MIEIVGNLFDQECDAICITTNGFIKNDGRAVMGMGCAKEIQKYVPYATTLLGKRLMHNGNIVQIFTSCSGVDAIAYPVKPQYGLLPPLEVDKSINTDAWEIELSDIVTHMQNKLGNSAVVPGWAVKAIPAIIERSAKELIKLTDDKGYERVVLPRPGCGAGELSWDQIGPMLHELLDDRFYSITF